MRDLRQSSSKLVSEARENSPAFVTSNGKPVAAIVPVDPDRIDEFLETYHRVEAEMALEAIHKDALLRRLDRLTDDDIEAEIRAARVERRG